MIHFHITNNSQVLQIVSFPQASTPKPCMHISSPQYELHAPPISFF